MHSDSIGHDQNRGKGVPRSWDVRESKQRTPQLLGQGSPDQVLRGCLGWMVVVGPGQVWCPPRATLVGSG